MKKQTVPVNCLNCSAKTFKIKTTTNFLPQQKQEEIAAITDALHLLLQPAMIILFGSYARGTFVDDSYLEDYVTYTYNSDYDMLVVVDDERQADVKQKTVIKSLRKHLHHELPVQVLIHGIEHLNEALEEGQYFFTDIIKEGVLLYNSGKYQLADPKILSHEERRKISAMYFEKWFQKGRDFITSYQLHFDAKLYNLSAFSLHQATESLLNTVELVFTHYKPKTHDLIQLYKNVILLDDRFKQVFPLTNKEEIRLFELLAKAYIDSRYKMNYFIAVEDLEYLSGRVKLLKEMVEDVCAKNIE